MMFSGLFTPPINLQPYALKSDIASVWSDFYRLEEDVSVSKAQQMLGATDAIPTVVALFETSLASAISSSATTMTLTSATDKAGTTLASSTYAFIIDENSSSEEMVLADCTGTACTNITRGINPLTGTSTTASLQKSHRRGASVKITDGPQLMILSRIMNGIGTFPNKIAYTSAPTFTAGNDIINKTYADALAIAGAPDSSATVKGIVEKASASEAESGAADGSGGTTAPLGLTTSIATSTCQSASSRVLVASSTTGKLGGNCIDQTYRYSFTTPQTFSSATTTFNGVDYRFPSAQAASSTVLSTNAIGQLSWINVPTIFVKDTASPLGSNAATTSIATYAVPANTIGTNGLMRYNVYFQSTTTVAAQFAGVSFGNGTATTSIGFVHLNNNSGPATTPYDASISGTIRNINSASSQSAAGIGIGSGLTTNTKGQYMATSTSYNTAATTYLSIDIKAASDNITAQGFTLEIIP